MKYFIIKEEDNRSDLFIQFPTIKATERLVNRNPEDNVVFKIFNNSDNFWNLAYKEDELKEILPARTLKPQVYQLRYDQSFAIGGLVRLDLMKCDHASCVFYMSDSLKIHRGKVSGADALWKKHYGTLFQPVPVTNQFKKYTIRKEMDKMDIVIDGLGWACVHGQMSTITVYVPENVNVTFRKAML